MSMNAILPKPDCWSSLMPIAGEMQVFVRLGSFVLLIYLELDATDHDNSGMHRNIILTRHFSILTLVPDIADDILLNLHFLNHT